MIERVSLIFWKLSIKKYHAYRNERFQKMMLTICYKDFKSIQKKSDDVKVAKMGIKDL